MKRVDYHSLLDVVVEVVVFLFGLFAILLSFSKFFFFPLPIYYFAFGSFVRIYPPARLNLSSRMKPSRDHQFFIIFAVDNQGIYLYYQGGKGRSNLRNITHLQILFINMKECFFNNGHFSVDEEIQMHAQVHRDVEI